MTQLILNAVYKLMHVDYRTKYLNFVFVKETLKDHRHDTLKKKTIENCNDEGNEKAMLQCDEMMEHVYENNKWVHASRKCFEKMLMYMKDDIPIPNSKMPIPTSTTLELKISTPKLEAFTFDLFGSLDSKTIYR